MPDDLENLTSQLGGAFQVDPEALGAHPRFSLYKNADKAATEQASRRRSALERLKEQRDDRVNRLRNLVFTDSEEEEENETGSGMDSTDTLAQNPFSAGFVKSTERKPRNAHAGKLMLSEWLIDIPESLSAEWQMVPAPVGKRVLVVANRGITTAYYKSGRIMKQFQSRLPGSYTVLDCISDFCPEGKYRKLYCLDVLYWNRSEMIDYPFSVRRFMLQSRLEESPELAVPTGKFTYTFHPLPMCQCTKEDMEDMMKTDFGFELDGLLFYYSEVVYEPGQSPLIGWLKPWMLPEILNVPVPESYMQTKYEDAHDFIEKFNKEHKHHSKVDRSMEV